MLYLVLSIACSTAIVLLFSWFAKQQLDTFQTIVANYLVCVSCAAITKGGNSLPTEFWNEPWFGYALFLGVIFISSFNIVALTVKHFSVTVATIMQKMSILASVIFALWAYHESINFYKIVGLLFAFLSILLVNLTKDGKLFDRNVKSWYLMLLPIATWVASSIIEIIFLKLEKETGQSSDLGFISLLFGTAGCIGLIVLAVGVISKRIKLHAKSLLSGIYLGIPNFGSIYFLLKALGIGWEGSVVFPINNVAIIAFSSILAVIIFSEALTKLNWVGVGLAILAIVMMALSI
ncbi:MAG: hypothetical protein AAFO07_29425 [Bacteroidota bacterium]